MFPLLGMVLWKDGFILENVIRVCWTGNRKKWENTIKDEIIFHLFGFFWRYQTSSETIPKLLKWKFYRSIIGNLQLITLGQGSMWTFSSIWFVKNQFVKEKLTEIILISSVLYFSGPFSDRKIFLAHSVNILDNCCFDNHIWVWKLLLQTSTFYGFLFWHFVLLNYFLGFHWLCSCVWLKFISAYTQR